MATTEYCVVFMIASQVVQQPWLSSTPVCGGSYTSHGTHHKPYVSKEVCTHAKYVHVSFRLSLRCANIGRALLAMSVYGGCGGAGMVRRPDAAVRDAKISG